MRRSARAILITRDKKLLLMKRIKKDKTYFVTIGGGIEEDEASVDAMIREVLEESGSQVILPQFAFHFEDTVRQNSVDFYIAWEVERGTPTGTEWMCQTTDNRYELVELTLDEAKNVDLCPADLKEKLLSFAEEALKPTIHLICGFLGAGKTTYAKQLARQLNAVYLNPDDMCVDMFSPEEYEANWRRCFGQAIDVSWEQINEAISKQRAVVFDMGFWTKESRDDARSRAIKMNAQTMLHYVTAPDDVLKQRLLMRSGKIAEENIRNFNEIKKKFEEPNEDEACVKIMNV